MAKVRTRDTLSDPLLLANAHQRPSRYPVALTCGNGPS